VTLDAVGALAGEAASLAWFDAVGAVVGPSERAAVERYLAGLGLAEHPVVGVADWSAAARIASAPDWDRRWWDAEQAQRNVLLDAATARHGRDGVMHALSAPAHIASDAAHAGAQQRGIDDALARVAAGAASQACYLAALAVLADAGAGHAFAVKFSLFAAGRWPLGVVGGRFHLF